ncbi:MAG: DUF1385 domain-containing protein [Dehalococcoidia bacterium]
MAEQPKFTYGGQAVIEGVMIRGRDHYSLAVRRQDGNITHIHEPLNTLFTGGIRRIPLVRGILILIETLMLGVTALHQSASMAVADQASEGEKDMPGWVLGLTLGVSLTIGIAVFFVLPLLLVWLFELATTSEGETAPYLISNVIEGGLRLAILVGYIWVIGFMKDIKRVFAYHGAEHMAVHAYEAGLPLTVENVRKFGTPHPRCGTAFLLTVVLVSIIVFAFLNIPDLQWRILSRVVLIPAIAAISYEIIRFSGMHQTWLLADLLAKPGLWLQRLTTRQPENDQIEVAITAMEAAVAADEGREFQPLFGPQAAGAPEGLPEQAATETPD